MWIQNEKNWWNHTPVKKCTKRIISITMNIFSFYLQLSKFKIICPEDFIICIGQYQDCLKIIILWTKAKSLFWNIFEILTLEKPIINVT